MEAMGTTGMEVMDCVLGRVLGDLTLDANGNHTVARRQRLTVAPSSWPDLHTSIYQVGSTLKAGELSRRVTKASEGPSWKELDLLESQQLVDYANERWRNTTALVKLAGFTLSAKRPLRMERSYTLFKTKSLSAESGPFTVIGLTIGEIHTVRRQTSAAGGNLIRIITRPTTMKAPRQSGMYTAQRPPSLRPLGQHRMTVKRPLSCNYNNS